MMTCRFANYLDLAGLKAYDFDGSRFWKAEKAFHQQKKEKLLYTAANSSVPTRD